MAAIPSLLFAADPVAVVPVSADTRGYPVNRIFCVGRNYAEVPTPAVRYPSFNAAFVHIWADMTDEEHRAHVEQLPLRKHFYRKMGRTGFSREEIDSALEQLRQTVERMERSFERTRWLASDYFTLADISIMPAIVRMDDLGLGYLWTDLPAVADWYKRIKSRRAFAQTYPAGSWNIHPSC